MNVEKKYILNKETAAHKIKRLAYEIAERNYDTQLVYFAAISQSGMAVARLLMNELKDISNLYVTLLEITLDKKNPTDVILSLKTDFTNQTILLIDDVSNSGQTMLYALRPFLEYHPRKIQTLALVERTHKTFPINIDYVGMSVATTLEEHIYVEFEKGEISGAYMY
jgi:pyrimidine operon attenuation protein / uracil phosphoribosyltransferase